MASIKLNNVSVDFPLYGVPKSFRHKLKTTVGGLISNKDEHTKITTVRALNNISMELNDGDRVALIGHNGAGKSTLLRLCAGIYQPISGQVDIEGRLSSVFSQPPGMDYEDTGYDNIITCGLFLGLSKNEIFEKLDEIEKISELGDYLNLPVRAYSTGMVIRLSFAIATSISPDIMIIDEHLGESDYKFINNAKLKIENISRTSSILLFASHSKALIKDLCDEAILMHNGEIVIRGNVDEVYKRYHENQSE